MLPPSVSSLFSLTELVGAKRLATLLRRILIGATFAWCEKENPEKRYIKSSVIWGTSRRVITGT